MFHRLTPLLAIALIACGGDDENGTVQDTSPDTDAFEVLLPDTSTPLDTGVPDATPDADTLPDSSGSDVDASPSDVSTDSVDDDVDTTTPGCSTFGCPCNANNECDSGVCIEGLDGQICTRSCLAECPDGFDCLLTGVGPDQQSVCVPRHTRLCRPCRDNAECQSPSDAFPAYCIPDPSPSPTGSSGSFCGSSCATRACPGGYNCEEVSVSGGGSARQCVPTNGECTCRPSWSDFGFSTDCGVTNTFGTCDGTRSCGQSGLSPCVGPQAAPEVCDDLDNDCDGQTDVLPQTPCYVTNQFGSCEGGLVCGPTSPVCEGKEPLPETCNGLDDNCNSQTDEATCNDSLICTTDTCVGPFQCANELLTGYCLINGACSIAGGFNPTNPCELCDPTRSIATWSQAPNTCSIGGACYPANAVNPQNACQICQPNQSTTTWSNASNTCQIGGNCYGANQANPANACEICSPTTSTTTWTQAQNTCNIQGACFAAGVARSGFPCQVCDPSRSATGWSSASSNVSCDDGNACSASSFCNGAGACVGDVSCNDGVVCTQDICNAATGCSNSSIVANYCRIGGVCYTDNTANPSNPCQRCNPAASTSSWSPQPTTVGCNDNAYCTVNDRCNGSGSCVGEARNCSDALSCTSDSCNEAGDSCANTLQNNQCIIGGACYANGTTQPNNVCYRCNSTTSTSNWSLNNGASCNDGDNCTSGDTCGSGTCSGSYIRDVYENNDAVSSPYNLGNYEDSQNFPQRSITSPTISGPGDVDWFQYFVDDVWDGDIEPRFRVSSISAAFSMEACFFFRCTNDDALPTELDCAAAGGVTGGNVTYGGKEYRGCCRSGTGSINLKLTTSDFECPSGDDNFRALVRVRTTNSSWSCSAPYTLEIGDD